MIITLFSSCVQPVERYREARPVVTPVTPSPPPFIFELEAPRAITPTLKSSTEDSAYQDLLAQLAEIHNQHEQEIVALKSSHEAAAMARKQGDELLKARAEARESEKLRQLVKDEGRAIITSLKRENARDQATIAALKKENSQHRATIDILNTQFKQSIATINKLRQQNMESSAQVSTAKTQRDQYIKCLERERSQHLATIQRLESEKKAAERKTAIAAQTARVQSTREEFANLTKKAMADIKITNDVEAIKAEDTRGSIQETLDIDNNAKGEKEEGSLSNEKPREKRKLPLASLAIIGGGLYLSSPLAVGAGIGYLVASILK